MTESPSDLWQAGTWFRVPRDAFAVFRGVGGAGLAVYLMLASYADQDGRSYPSVGSMATALGLTRRAIQKALRSLEVKGYIVVERGAAEGRNPSTNRYRLLPIPPVTGRTGVPPQTVPGDERWFAPGANGGAPRGANGGAPELDHKKNYTKRTRPRRAADAALVAIPLELASCEEFTKAWGAWTAYRRSRRLSCLAATLTKQLDFLATLGPTQAVAAIHTSIRNGWAGLFPPKKGVNDEHVQPTLGQRHPADRARW